ncbi:hypothetical protein OMK64_13660 [Cellulomonas fimi]|uniref:hypothetical protein n=1 Tax=Cellulomonas fimi TaxID=1708 RepID=UPI00234C064F|nr:hypothetical protein [Cellulomonas fimi]MDC7122582.1 hypothetical protein [Cellulomonas fimi]
MRWPWQRDRAVPPVADPGARASRTGAGVAASPVPDPPGSSGSSGSPTGPRGADAPGAPESTAGWAFLPPLQRTVRPAELTSRPVAFLADLPTRAALPFTGSMTHVVDHRAPSGVVDGDGDRSAPPVQRSADVDLTLLPPAPRAATPVQRRTGRLVALDSAPAGTPRLRAVPVDPPAPDTPTVTPLETAPSAGAAGAGGWTADGWAAPDASGASGPDGSWRDAGGTTVPIGSSAPPTAAPAPSRTDGGAAVQRRVGLGAPISRSPLAATPPDLPLVQRDTTSAPRGPVRTGGERGAGAGSPATAEGADATLRRSAEPSGVPAARVDPPAPTSPSALDLAGPSDAGGTADAGGAGGVPPVQRVVGDPTVLGAPGGPPAATPRSSAPLTSAPTASAASASGSGGTTSRRPDVPGPSTAPVQAEPPRPAPTSTDALALVQRRTDGPTARTGDGATGLTAGDFAAPVPAPADGTPVQRSDTVDAARPTTDLGSAIDAPDPIGAVAATAAAPASGTAETPHAAASDGASPAADAPSPRDAAERGSSAPTLGVAAPVANDATSLTTGPTGLRPDAPTGASVSPAGHRAGPTTDLTLASPPTPVQRSSGQDAALTAPHVPGRDTPSGARLPTLGTTPAGGSAHSATAGAGRGTDGTASTPAAPPAPPPPAPSSPAPTDPAAAPPVQRTVTGSEHDAAPADNGAPRGPAWTDTPPTARRGAAPAVSLDAPRPAGGSDLPVVVARTDARATTAEDNGSGTGTTTSGGGPTTTAPDMPTAASTATPGARSTTPAGGSTTGARPTAALQRTGAGTAPSTPLPDLGRPLRVGPLLAGTPVPVQLTERRPPTVLAGRPAARRAVPVQRVVVGAPSPSTPTTGGATLSATVLDHDPTGAVPASGAADAPGADATPAPAVHEGPDGIDPWAPPDAAVTTRADLVTLQAPAATTSALALPSTSTSRAERRPATVQRASADGPLAAPGRATDDSSTGPASSLPSGLDLAGAPSTTMTTDRPLTPLSPGGVGAPGGLTVSRSTRPVPAPATPPTGTATGTAASPDALPLVQRRAERAPTTVPPEPPAARPTLQRSDDAAPPPPVATPVVAPDAAGEAPDGSGASPFASATPADLDELARRLMTPLMRRVRGQLLVDRERRGTRTDR